MFSSSASSASTSSLLFSNDSSIALPSSTFTSLTKNVLNSPTKTAIIDVITITKTIEPIILPKRFGCFILAIDVLIVKNTNGTIITNIKFKKMSPNGLKTVAPSFHIKPIIAPIIIESSNITV